MLMFPVAVTRQAMRAAAAGGGASRETHPMTASPPAMPPQLLLQIGAPHHGETGCDVRARAASKLCSLGESRVLLFVRIRRTDEFTDGIAVSVRDCADHLAEVVDALADDAGPRSIATGRD